MKKRNKTIALSLAVVFSCVSSLLLAHPSFADISAPYSIFHGDSIDTSMGDLTLHTLDSQNFLYKGPDASYGKNDDNYHLPTNIDITSTKYDSLWAFVEYEGRSGWVYHGPKTSKYCPPDMCLDDLFGHIADKEASEVVIASKTLTFYDKPLDGNIIKTMNINELSTIKYEYYLSDSYGIKSGSYYVADEGWIYNPIFAYSTDKKILILESTKIQDTFESSSNIIVTALSGTELEFDYAVGEKYPTFYHVKTPGYAGWVNIDNCPKEKVYGGPEECDNFAIILPEPETLVLNESEDIYDTFAGEKTGEILEKGSYNYRVRKNDKESNDWYYIEKTQSNFIWIKTEDEYKKRLADIESRGISSQESTPEKILCEEGYRIENGACIPNEEKNNEQKKIFYWLIIGCGILSISIIVVLILAKKHKKNKENASDDGGDNSEKSEEKAEENKPNSNEDDAENESKIEEISDENESNSEENSCKNEQNSDEDNAENELESAEDEEEIDQNPDDVSDNFDKNREEIEEKTSEKAENSSDENESYFEKELEKIEKETEEKSDEIDQNFAKMEDEIEPNTTKIEDEIEPGIAKTKDEIEPNSKKEQKKSSKKSAKKQMKEGGEDE